MTNSQTAPCVVSRKKRSEEPGVVFIVFRRVGLSDEEFRADWGTVQKDLAALKRVLEK